MLFTVPRMEDEISILQLDGAQHAELVRDFFYDKFLQSWISRGE